MILVTGAGGWLGAELTKQLLKKGYKVKALNNIETEQLKDLKKTYKDNLQVIIGNICDKDIIEKCVQGIDTVYHLAAKVHCIPTNEREEEEFFSVNTVATENIFKECLKNDVKKVIFFSTVSVYEQSNELITINSRKNPNTIYGKSKLEAEKIARKLFKQKGLPVIIIEPTTVYGEGDRGNFKKLENMINKRICIKFGNGKNKKTVIYYKDLITTVINIAENKENLGKTIICGTEILTINEINNTLIKKNGKRVFKIIIPKVFANLLVKICCFGKLKKIRRKIIALMQNNEFEINNQLKNYTKFVEYELNKNKNGGVN